jgi:prepilin-type N-terminal cleavage/methylation domain-containing protein
MPRRPATARAARLGARPVRRHGFTIVEMLVTLVIVVAVVASVSRLFVNQLRSYARTQASTAAQRDLRLGLSLLPMDLRAASVQLHDVQQMTDSMIELRATIGSSIVCGRPDSLTIDLPPQNLAKNVLTSWYALPAAGDWITVYVSSDLDPSQDSWRLLKVAAIAPAPNTSCVGAPFTDPVLDPPATKPRWRITLSDTLSTTNAALGKPVRFLRAVKYSLYQPSGSSSKWYLGYRDSVGGVWSAIEPIAGPFAAYASTGSGVKFAYFDTTGAQLPNPTLADRIGRVDVALRSYTRVRSGKDSVIVRDSVKLRIALRNRQTQ